MDARKARRAAGNRISRKQRRKTAHADNMARAAANVAAAEERRKARAAKLRPGVAQ